MLKDMVLKAIKDALDQNKDGVLDVKDLLAIIEEIVKLFKQKAQ